MTTLLDLAGLTESRAVLYKQLTEVVDLTSVKSIEDIIARLDACKRALSIANKLPEDQGRKKWISACFVNLNKVRGLMQTMMKNEGIKE